MFYLRYSLDCGDLIIPKGELFGSFNLNIQFTPLYGRNWKNVDWYVGQEKSYIQETRKNKIGM